MKQKKTVANICQWMPLVPWRTNWHWFFEDVCSFTRLTRDPCPFISNCKKRVLQSLIEKQVITIFIVTGIVRATLGPFQFLFVGFCKFSVQFFNLLFFFRLFIYSFRGIHTLIYWKYFTQFFSQTFFFYSLHVIGLLETILDSIFWSTVYWNEWTCSLPLPSKLCGKHRKGMSGWGWGWNWMEGKIEKKYMSNPRKRTRKRSREKGENDGIGAKEI